jgi:predicted nucleic acid-binding protein
VVAATEAARPLLSQVICVDTTVVVKFVTGEDGWELADRVIAMAEEDRSPTVAPTWLWAEVGSVLRKKTRLKEISADDASRHWLDFQDMGVNLLDSPEIRQRAWEIAEQFNLSTLYDAAFLACTELAPAVEGAQRVFWTADRQLIRQLGDRRPAYVRELQELAQSSNSGAAGIG